MNADSVPTVYSLMFREGHQKFDGEVAYRAIFTELLLHTRPAVELRVGTLLPQLLAYRMSGITPQVPGSPMPSYGQQLRPDKALFATMATDLAESCCTLWHDLNSNELIVAMARGSVFAVTIVGLSEALTKALSARLRKIPAYLGACEIDLGNPWVRRVAVDGLLPFGQFAEGTLSMIDDGTRFEPYEHWADGTGLRFGASIAALQIELPQVADSLRGAQSRMLIETRAAPTPAETVVRELWASSSVDSLPRFTLTSLNDGPPTAQTRKFVEYLLNEDHKKGRHKARLFKSRLGIAIEHRAYLAEQLMMGLANADVRRVRVSEHGATYGADIPVRGVNGTIGVVHTAWIIRPTGPPSLVTARPHERAPTPSEVARVTNVVFVQERQPQVRWSTLYEMADAVGQATVSRTTPTPMATGDAFDSDAKLQVYADGLCGYGFVEITQKHSGFVRWLRKHGIIMGGRRHLIHYAHPSQSVDRAKAYCDAFARVLRMNNVACEAIIRLD